MAKLATLETIDRTRVPLPIGTRVTTRVERLLGERRIPQGAVGRVVGQDDSSVEVELADGTLVSYLRTDLVPTKLGQMRFAVRREAAWQALLPCAVLETQVGSHAWGLADESSDVDRRGIFVLPFGWTISLVEPPRELVSTDGSVTYWEIDKAIGQALRADPNTLETLFLPSAQSLDPMGEWLLEARDAFVSQDIYGSFGRYAISQLEKLRQSLRLAEHRESVLTWLREEPLASLDHIAARLAERARIEAPSERDRLLRAKSYLKQLYGSLYDRGLLGARDFTALVRYAQTGEADLEIPRQLRPKNAYNLLRLIATANAWLERGRPDFEMRGALRDRLLAIKRGEVPLDDIIAEAEAMMPALDAARAHSALPRRPDVTRVDELLRRIRSESARRHFAGDPGPPMPLACEEDE